MSQLVTAGAKNTKDFKCACTMHLAFKSRQANPAQYPADYVELNQAVIHGVHAKFQSEARASETDCTCLLNKLSYTFESTSKFECAVKSVLRTNVSTLQHNVRIEDPSAYRRNGPFSRYKDHHGASGAGGAVSHEAPREYTPQLSSLFHVHVCSTGFAAASVLLLARPGSPSCNGKGP